MTASFCSEHPDQPAAYVCDGCQRCLCIDCSQEGKALIFCAHCGELAIPVDDDGRLAGVNAAETSVAGAAYGFGEALTFPLRRPQLFYLATFSILFWLLETLRVALPEAGCVFVVPRTLLWTLVPMLLADVVRITAAGSDRLLEAPDFRHVWARLLELVGFLAAAPICASPGAFLLSVSGCISHLARPGILCLPVALAALWIAALLWLLSFGSSVAFSRFWLILRYDLHWQAFQIGRRDALIAAAVSAGAIALALAVEAASASLPLLAALLGPPLTLYAALLGAHQAGLFFRWHLEALQAVYR